MRAAAVGLSVVLILAFGIPAIAHHAFAGLYQLDQTTTIEGTISKIAITNPHSIVTINVKEADGKTTPWVVAWASVNILRNAGIDRSTFKFGDKVTITGAPEKDRTRHSLLMGKIRRDSDGLSWGGRPGEAVQGYVISALAATAPVNGNR